MANEIKKIFSAVSAATITLASLASSTAGVGRQSDVIDNTSTGYDELIVFLKLKQGTTPTSARGAYLYLIGVDDIGAGTVHRSDNAGASDAGITVLNSRPIGVIGNKASGAATGDEMWSDPITVRGGIPPKFAFAVVHDTAVNLDSTGSNHWLRWIGVKNEIQ